MMSHETLTVVRHDNGQITHEGKQHPSLRHLMAEMFGGTPSDYGYEDAP